MVCEKLREQFREKGLTLLAGQRPGDAVDGNGGEGRLCDARRIDVTRRDRVVWIVDFGVAKIGQVIGL